MTNAVPAYPLQWPRSIPRTSASSRERSRFGNFAWNRALTQLRAELGLLGAEYVTISTMQKIRQDGEPYAVQGKIEDPGVAVYFVLNGEQLCFPCDRWLTLPENIRAVTLHIESMRGQQRWGVGTAKQAFTGYKALTATAGESESCWLVLGVTETATEDEIKAAHRSLSLTAHPDRGGSADQMARINIARDRGLAAVGGR